MLGDVQDPARVAAEPEAGEVDHMDGVVAGQLGREWHQVAVGYREAVNQDQRGGVGTVKRGAVMGVDPRTIRQRLWNPQPVSGALVASRYRPRAARRAPATPVIS